MTAIAITRRPRLQKTMAMDAKRRGPSRSWLPPGLRPSDGSAPVITLTGMCSWIENQGGQSAFPVSPPGVIGGAVLRACRRSAGLSKRPVARMLGVSLSSVRAWEEGACPLFCVRYDQLCQLADALSRVGAQIGPDVRELLLASQCDLLITGILHGFEDYGEVPPVDENEDSATAARGLLRWALTGVVPQRYRRYAVAGPLLTAS